MSNCDETFCWDILMTYFDRKGWKWDGYITVFYFLYRRPCKIWAPYGGYCVEKSLAPKSKYADTPKPDSINCLDRIILRV